MKEKRSVIFLADGERVPLGDADWDGDAEDGNTFETMNITVPARILGNIFAAKKVEGQIGHREFVINTLVLRELRSISAIREAAQSPPVLTSKPVSRGAGRSTQPIQR